MSPERIASFKRTGGQLVLVGAGKMGSALLEGWLSLGLPAQQTIVLEPHPSPEVLALTKRGIVLNPPETSKATALVLAIKPQVAAEVLPTLMPWVSADTLVLSIMAGRTLSFLQRMLPSAKALVRAMPNTPASIKRGVTVVAPNDHVDGLQRDLAHLLFAAIGQVEWIEDEALMDAVTAVSGTGPAYLFLLAECLARAGVALGLPADLSDRIARATISGAGELLHQSTLPAATLRENVTSPGGTTAAAMTVLMAPTGLGPLIENAVSQAARRSRELAS